jgi:hypothetical protein
MVSDVGLVSAVASIAEGASVSAGARYNTVSEGTIQETLCLRNQLQKRKATDSGKRKIGCGIVEHPAKIRHRTGK